MQQTRASRRMSYGLHHRMDFGKHVGSTIRLLIEHNNTTRQYLQWAKKNIEGFYLDNNAYQLLQKHLK